MTREGAEVDAVDDEVVISFRERGWALTRSLDDTGAARLRSWVEEVASWPDDGGDWMHHRELTESGPALCRSENLVPHHAGLRALLTEGAMPAVAGALLGEPAVLYKEKVNYKLEDLVPISASGNGPMVLAVNAAMPVKSLQEFIDHVKANPGKYAYASAGIGSVAHLVAALLVERAGLQALHVPYRGGGPAVSDLMGGQVSFYFGNAPELLPHKSNDRVRIIAVSTSKRMPQLPDVPAVAEVIPGFEMSAWQGFLAPVRTPQPIVSRLEQEISGIAKEPAVVVKLAKLGVEATSMSQAQFVEVIRKEQGIYAEAVKAAGLARN